MVTESILYLDGESLGIDDLYRLGHGHDKIQLTAGAEQRVKQGRELLEKVIDENQVVYGVNTGFGKFASELIDKKDLETLQVNLVRSHASGVGEPLSIERVRRIFALRINALAKGYSGVSLETLNQLIDIFNKNCLSWVPEKGTVGASGDLAPLAHLTLGLIGEGKMWSSVSGWADAGYVLKMNGLHPLKLKPKEGLALLNGTQFITSIGAEAVKISSQLAKQADVVAALSLEALRGTSRAFDADIHRVRPHKGQIRVAKILRALLLPDSNISEIARSQRFNVQDAYTLRCIPQVHGVVHDTIDFVEDILTVEMNSATDNPLVFPERADIISGGNFHGEYPAKVLDYLAIAIHEIGSISERRIERLINPHTSGLPAFLVKKGGLNSGFMIVHCTSAALENKVLCHPASVDSLPTSAGTEDHVSMGGFSARKALMIAQNVEKIVAIELLTACQAIEFLRPLKSTEPLEKVFQLVRSTVKKLECDRFMAPDIEAVLNLIHRNKIWDLVKPYIERYQDEPVLVCKNKVKDLSTLEINNNEI